MFDARRLSWLLALLVGVMAWVYIMRLPTPMADPVPGAGVEHAHHDHVGHDHAGHGATVSRIVTTAFDGSGVLNAVEALDKRILFSTSQDGGRTFSTPVEVAVESEAIDVNGEARPKVAIGPAGEIFVTWTRKGPALYTGDIRFARSVDGGRTFSTPVTINDDNLPVGHRFDSLAVAPDGTVVIAWIDKRDIEHAAEAGEEYRGAAVYVATSADGGETFTANRKVADHSCECCRIAVAFEDDATPVLFWRHVLPGGIRDHVVARLAGHASVEPTRVDYGGWEIEACPHHGPAMTIAPGSGTYHFAWFTGAESTGNAVFYARSTDKGRTIGPAAQVGTGALAGHPSFAVTDRTVWLAWKEWRDDNTTRVMAMSSADDGVTWSAPRELASAGLNSDRPFLITGADGAVYLSWADPESVRIVPVS